MADTRRSFLKAAFAGGAGMAAGRAAARGGDPAISELKPLNRFLGEGVDARPYGLPTEHEGG